MTPPALLVAALAALVAAALALHDEVPGLSPPLCERPDCTCTEDADDGPRETRGLRVTCDFGQSASATASTSSNQLVTLGDASLPARLRHLQVAGGGQVEVRLLQKAFAHLQLLERATFSRLRRLLVRHHAFTNASSDGQGFSAGRGLLLEIEDCDAVVL
ncbi:uncharacterized protein LOC127751949, partial [Frankliniella occidentalis]|uniref:Uncharacterized protein LOC127751949 n=1 Tax=Frankliniella occidentalis TaxID=133901 RepID=A0A9C6XV44_FRAOC